MTGRTESPRSAWATYTKDRMSETKNQTNKPKYNHKLESHPVKTSRVWAQGGGDFFLKAELEVSVSLVQVQHYRSFQYSMHNA